MNKSIIYIVGGTVLVGGAYLFLKNKKAKDLSKLTELGGTTIGGATTGGTTSGGTTSGGTTSSLSNTSDGVTPSDANLNLANATVLVGQRAILNATANKSCLGLSPHTLTGSGIDTSDTAGRECRYETYIAKKKLVELDKKLATLGYKVDATGTLVKI